MQSEYFQEINLRLAYMEERRQLVYVIRWTLPIVWIIYLSQMYCP